MKKVYVFGPIWIAAILKLKEDHHEDSKKFNFTDNCGLNNYPYSPLPSSASKPTSTSIYIFVSTLVGSCLLDALITYFFIDEIDENTDEDDKTPVRLVFDDGNKTISSDVNIINVKQRIFEKISKMHLLILY